MAGRRSSGPSSARLKKRIILGPSHSHDAKHNTRQPLLVHIICVPYNRIGGDLSSEDFICFDAEDGHDSPRSKRKTYSCSVRRAETFS
jgi:hypothetical protein